MTDDFLSELQENLKPKPEQSLEGHVVIRTFMQKMVFKIYPNGNIAIDPAQSSSWFTDSKQMWVKKKQSKKKAPVIKVADVVEQKNIFDTVN